MTHIPDDAGLLSRVADGDVDALRDLLERYGETVWSSIDTDISPPWRSMIDADDVMQITYMEAFLQMENLRATNAQSFVGWLRRIAQNNLRDAIKELERKKRPHPARRAHAPAGGDSYVTLVEMLGESAASPSRHVAKQEAAQVIDDVLQRMPPDYAKVVRLYDLGGKDIDEVAKAMNRSSGAVHMLRARAHERLRRLLGAETDFFTHTA